MKLATNTNRRVTVPGRGRKLGLSLAILAVVSVAPVSRASIFGHDKSPVPQWAKDAAKVPTPAYAADANAVILYDEYVETVDAAGRATEREREAIRILKPQGRGNSCGISYDVDEKINYFRVWVIGSDGKEYPTKEEEFTDEGDTGIPVMLSTRKERLAHPSAADVGSTIVCESEELMEPYLQEKVWEIQNGIPIVFEALELDLPAGRAHSEAWHKHDPVPPVEISPNHFRWEMKDIPALNLRGISEAPAWAALAGRMTAQWGEAAVAGKENQWKAIGQWVTELEANRPDPSPEITARVQELTAGAPDFYTKLSRITESIQKDIRYFIVIRGIGGLQANRARDIFQNRYGDCKDKTTLLISMLQVAGIKAYYMPVDDRRGIVDPDDPSLVGNHMITAIEIPAEVQDPRLKAIAKGKDGKRYLIFDPTNERTPVGTIPAYEQGSYGILAAGASSQILALPVLGPDASGTERTGEFHLAADGTLSGGVDTVRVGSVSGEMRSGLKYSDEKERHDELEQSLGTDLPGVMLNKFHYDEPSALDQPIKLHYDVTAHQYAKMIGPLMLVRPRVVASYAHPFDRKPRTIPIELGETGHWHDSYDIALPEGYVVDELPDPVTLDMDFATDHSKITGKGSNLHYERDYTVKQVELPAEKQTEFNKLEAAILADEKATAVLKKTVAGQVAQSGSTQ